MTDRTRDVVFQLSGGVLALAIAIAGAFFGTAGLIVGVTVGVFAGYAMIKMLYFAHRFLAD